MIQICGREELDVHQPKRDARGHPADAVLCLHGDGSGDCGGVRGAVVPGGGHRRPPDKNNLLEFDLKKGVLRKTGLMFDKSMGACSNFKFKNGLSP
jgi:hypothetical protein